MKYRIERSADGDWIIADIVRRGQALLFDPLLNKGTAFSHVERVTFGLEGMIPSQFTTRAEQVRRAYEHIQAKGDNPLEKYVGMVSLQDRNATASSLSPLFLFDIFSALCIQVMSVQQVIGVRDAVYPEQRDGCAVIELDDSVGNGVSITVLPEGGERQRDQDGGGNETSERREHGASSRIPWRPS